MQYPTPSISDSAITLFEEKGRVINDVDYSPFTVALAQDFDSYHVIITSGAGTESFFLTFDPLVADAISNMPSDARFLTLLEMREIKTRFLSAGFNKAQSIWQRAAAEDRIKTRKLRGRNEVRVWIEEFKV